MAERLYYGEQGRLEFRAEVTDIRLESRLEGKNRWQVALDRTAFYPESGGQPWDTGRLEAVSPSGSRLDVPVLAVVEEAGEVWHVVEKPLSAGTAVSGAVDGARRRDHMQQHTGQHLLSAVFLRELKAATVSFHLGAESSTIDLGVETLGRDEVVGVELAVNDLIGQDRPVAVTTVERGEAEAMLARGDLRKLPEREGAIRVVEIEGVEWNACGGTHVRSTGQIGGCVVRRVERMKAGVRVEFCCGLRAVRAARRDFEELGEAGRALSVAPLEIAAKTRGMLEEARAAAKQHKALLEEMAAVEAGSLVGSAPTVVARTREVSYAKLLAAKIARLGRIGIVSAPDGERATVVLAAQELPCNAAIQAALAVCGGRGGGAAGMAQATVAAPDLDRLIAEIERSVEAARLG